MEGALWLLVKAVVVGGWWAWEERYVGSFGSADWSSVDSGARCERCGEWGKGCVYVDAGVEGVEINQWVTTALKHLIEWCGWWSADWSTDG